MIIFRACILNVLCSVVSKYYVGKVFIFGCNLSVKLKTIHSQTYVYMKLFLCFDVQKTLLKLVQVFQIDPV